MVPREKNGVVDPELKVRSSFVPVSGPLLTRNLR